MHKVLIANTTYQDCREAVTQIFAAFPLAIRGKRVLVKPNLVKPAEPEAGLITHPAILQAVVEKVEELGASEIIVGDNVGGGSYGRNEATFIEAGMMGAARGHYRNIGKEAHLLPFDPTFIEYVFVSREVLEADLFISVPKFKTHRFVGLSVAIKNNFGILPGAQKANFHARVKTPVDFARLQVEVFRLRPPDLTIVDGVLAMQGPGPFSAELRYLGKVLAADNGVALDATVARMMGYDPSQVPLLRFAQDRGLGSYKAEDIEILGCLETIPGYVMPPLAEITSTVPREHTGRLAQAALFRPLIEPQKCDGCAICAQVCPPGALRMTETLPALDASLCIPCYCCQESCPREAITMASPPA
jgi:uncharacterized protein (DUF362 family)/NAD-dependent dihydropyrimidine dehydrogenase PreA subunit